jgi:hypothetical protein
MPLIDFGNGLQRFLQLCFFNEYFVAIGAETAGFENLNSIVAKKHHAGIF